MKYIVYITKNIENNKQYIGVHETKDPDIFDGYIGCGVWVNSPSSYVNPITPFQHAVKKYGPSKFIRSTIAIFNTKEDAYSLEKQLVTKEIVYSKNYYNACLGGIQPILIDSVIYQYDEFGNYINSYTVGEAADRFKLTKGSFYGAIKHGHKLANYYWSYLKLDYLDINNNPNKAKTVYKYSLDGVCIEVFDSLHKTENPSRICLAIKYNKPYKNNYYSYEYYETYIPKNSKISLRNTTIYIYDNKGKLFKKTIGLKNTLEAIHGKSKESVYNKINSGESYKGFRLYTYPIENLKEVKNINTKKSVLVYNLNNELLKEYDSVNAAIKELNLDSSSAHRVLKGTQNQTKGYILKYK